MTGDFFRVTVAVLSLWGVGCLAGQHWVGAGDRVVAWTNDVPADRVRLGVRDEGVYRVSAEDIAVAAGVSAEDVRSALAADGLALSNGVQAVAWTTDGDALYFFGVPTVELFAPENVYWLTFGPGMAMTVYDATPDAGAATNQWFMHAESYRSAFLAPYDARDRRSSVGTLTNVLNFGEWVRGSSTESYRVQVRTVTMPGFCAAATTGVVARVSAVSYYDFASPDNQTCEVWLNGANCGSQSWSGEQAVSFDRAAAPGVVTNGPVQVKIRNGLTAQVNDFMLLDAALLYPHTYAAISNALLCTGGDAQTVAVDGLASGAIGVWDVTDPEEAAVLDAPVWQATNGTWNVAFLCGDAATRYAVFEMPAGCFEPSVSGVRDTDWSDPEEMPELAIVIPPRRWITGFDAAVQPLADFRNAQGVRTRIIDAEELYNAFAGGRVHPVAFRRFCASGVTNGPSQRLRYLLFAGHAGSDYKLEVFRPGTADAYPALFPLYLYAQIEDDAPAALMLPCDPVLGDVVGDAVPEVAVGRFIATDAVGLSQMVAKTIQYERTETWKRKGLFVACREYYSNDLDFSNIVAQTAAKYVPGGWAPLEFHPPPPTYPMNVMWEDTYNEPPTGARVELDEGAGLLYYFGHSSDTLLGVTTTPSTGCFVQSTTIMNGSWSFAPVAMLMGCRLARWTLLDLKTHTQCLAEAGVRNPTSGFAAVIGASGYLQPNEAVSFSNGFSDRIAAGARRLGDAWCGAFAAVGGATATKLLHLSLLGDPSLCISADATARGTSTSWLVAQGLTGDPYADLEDPDGDGFATWQEVQAGTDYQQMGLKIRGLAVPGPAAGGLSLTFEPVAGLNYRVVATTNLASGVWETLAWKASEASSWSWSGIPVDWPVETVLVPFAAEDPRRFYKVESYVQ